MTRAEDLERFYWLLELLEQRLGGKRTLAECSGRLEWPNRGVYFFFEHGETRSESGLGNRVVRVGTHALAAASSTTLWKRLSQHRGTARSGGGNHRGSIFRLLVGEALMRRDGLTGFDSWGIKGDPGAAAAQLGRTAADVRTAEYELESAVTRYVSAMPFLWLSIEDEPGPDSSRGFFERQSIALLSNFDRAVVDPPSAGWLGQFSGRERVRRSGLWNNRHVDEEHAPAFLDALEIVVSS